MCTGKGCTSKDKVCEKKEADICTEFVYSILDADALMCATESTTSRNTITACYAEATTTTTMLSDNGTATTAFIAYAFNVDTAVASSIADAIDAAFESVISEWESTSTTTTTTKTTKATSKTTTGPAATSTLNTSPDKVSYSCHGISRECGVFVGLHLFCDVAKSYIWGDEIYGGECYTNNVSGGFGCGVFVKGDGAYDHLIDSGCKICGQVEFSNGCHMRVDYVSGYTMQNDGPAHFCADAHVFALFIFFVFGDIVVDDEHEWICRVYPGHIFEQHASSQPQAAHNDGTSNPQLILAHHTPTKPQIYSSSLNKPVLPPSPRKPHIHALPLALALRLDPPLPEKHLLHRQLGRRRPLGLCPTKHPIPHICCRNTHCPAQHPVLNTCASGLCMDRDRWFVSTDAILQAGIGIVAYKDANTDKGAEAHEYTAWYEWYPGDVVGMDLAIHAGDVLVLSVYSTSDSGLAGVAMIRNKSTGQNVTAVVRGPAGAVLSGQLLSDGLLVLFVDFGTVRFDGAAAGAEGGSCVLGWWG
ncbi:peptidase A4 family-domain-containing protein [Aspergillus cavernicola]|uniref:Peptidase A4 family-domain-containing protein n=1 Tax=Aspergillus cavernicola TaxID=176166 RepID=A0ABR4HEZ2_9EURO